MIDSHRAVLMHGAGRMHPGSRSAAVAQDTGVHGKLLGHSPKQVALSSSSTVRLDGQSLMHHCTHLQLADEGVCALQV